MFSEDGGIPVFFSVGQVPAHLTVPLQLYLTKLVADSLAFGYVPDYPSHSCVACDRADENVKEIDKTVLDGGLDHVVASGGGVVAEVNEVDDLRVGEGAVAAPVHRGGEGVVAEEHYGEETGAYRGDIELKTYARC